MKSTSKGSISKFFLKYATLFICIATAIVVGFLGIGDFYSPSGMVVGTGFDETTTAPQPNEETATGPSDSSEELGTKEDNNQKAGFWTGGRSSVPSAAGSGKSNSVLEKVHPDIQGVVDSLSKEHPKQAVPILIHAEDVVKLEEISKVVEAKGGVVNGGYNLGKLITVEVPVDVIYGLAEVVYLQTRH